MAKIMYGNYNDLPWMPNHRKDVDGKVMCYMKCFAMEAANMHMCIGKMYNGMPIGPHTHPNEQIATVVKGECDYWVDLPPGPRLLGQRAPPLCPLRPCVPLPGPLLPDGHHVPQALLQLRRVQGLAEGGV